MLESSKVLVHIGQPKSYSTFYQKHLTKLEAENKCDFIGVRTSLGVEDWYSCSTEQELLERGLRYDSHKRFRQRSGVYKDFINAKVKRASESNIPLIISAENLAMQVLPGEIDVEDKLKRLLYLLGDIKVTFVCVFRQIGSAIESLYKEMVNLGYGYPFKYFQYETWLNKEHCYLDALFPHRLLQQIEHIKTPLLKVAFFYTKNTPVNFLPELSEFDEDEIVYRGRDLVLAEQVALRNAQKGVSASLSSLTELHRKHWNREIASQDLIWHKRRLILENVNDVLNMPEHSYGKSVDVDWDINALRSFINTESNQCIKLLSSAPGWLVQQGKLIDLFKT